MNGSFMNYKKVRSLVLVLDTNIPPPSQPSTPPAPQQSNKSKNKNNNNH
jgi:hypothetical protein